jgi:AcrR family transcriptional regulator
MSTRHRETKKLRIRQEILTNAIALFCDQGVRAARSAAIAEASQVAPATLFNYFPSRSILAGAWVRGELIGVFQAEIRETEAGGLRAGVRRACRELARLTLLDPMARLEAWRIASRSLDPVVAELQERFAARVASEQKAGRVRSDLAAAEIASLLLDAAEGALIRALGSIVDTGGPRDEEALASALRGRVDLVLDGARKRNERVAAPGLGTAVVGGGLPRSEAEP